MRATRAPMQVDQIPHFFLENARKSLIYLLLLMPTTSIGKMHFSHWKPPGVSKRMWSVNSDASVSGEYQTLGGHSGRPSEYLRSLMTCSGVPWESLWYVWEHLGVPERTLGAHWNTWERWRQPWEHQQQSLEHRGQALEHLGAPATSLGAPQVTVKQSGKNIIFFGNVAGAPRDHSNYLSFNDFWPSCIQCVFSSINLNSYRSTHTISRRAAGGASEQFKVRLKVMIE